MAAEVNKKRENPSGVTVGDEPKSKIAKQYVAWVRNDFTPILKEILTSTLDKEEASDRILEGMLSFVCNLDVYGARVYKLTKQFRSMEFKERKYQEAVIELKDSNIKWLKARKTVIQLEEEVERQNTTQTQIKQQLIWLKNLLNQKCPLLDSGISLMGTPHPSDCASFLKSLSEKGQSFINSSNCSQSQLEIPFDSLLESVINSCISLKCSSRVTHKNSASQRDCDPVQQEEEVFRGFHLSNNDSLNQQGREYEDLRREKTESSNGSSVSSEVDNTYHNDSAYDYEPEILAEATLDHS